MAEKARCLTCRTLHDVEMKKKVQEDDSLYSVDYGTHTLPKKFWTIKKADK